MARPPVNVLLISSHVVYGHVGGQAAVPALQRLGHEVWHLPTVLFSNNPAHGGFAGEPVRTEQLAALIDGLAARGFLARVDAVLSGYLGTAETAALTAETVAGLRRERQVLYCCDPVLGDHGRRYVADGILECLRDRLLPLADLATPNRDELGWLAGETVDDLNGVVAAAERLRHRGAGSVICTSAEVTAERLTTILVGAEGRAAVEVARAATVPHGTGDLFAALLLAGRLAGLRDGEALARAAAQTRMVVEASVAAGSDELALIEALDRLAAPGKLPDIRPLH